MPKMFEQHISLAPNHVIVSIYRAVQTHSVDVFCRRKSVTISSNGVKSDRFREHHLHGYNRFPINL